MSDHALEYYIAGHPSRDVRIGTIWTFSGDVAQRVDAPQTSRIISGKPPNILVQDLPGFTFQRLNLRPGHFIPRMARPSNQHLHDALGFNPATQSWWESIQTSNGQLIALKEQIERIFRVVQPDPTTLNVFGHDIRNLLILASTEVEACWKAVLSSNGYAGNSTHDYVKLAAPMRLADYSVDFPYYPWIKPVRPFSNWSAGGRPTKDLPWYDAYNLVKHDQESNFPKATLNNALHALCGCFVMMCAQFGELNYWSRAELQSFFSLVDKPDWQLTEVYCRPLHGEEFVPQPYSF